MHYDYDDKTHAKGKLTKVSSTVSTTEYTSFDILGRVTGAKQTTDGGSAAGYSTGYTYTLGGALDEETYPSGRVVKNVLNTNGDLATVKSKKISAQTYVTYASDFTYNAAGAVTSMELGNLNWEKTVFNSRLQPTQIALGKTAGATDLLKLDYSYGTTGNNGNVLTQDITVTRAGLSPLVFNQAYTYDSLNRLKVAEEETGTTTNWKQTFTFDRYGNRNFDHGNTSQPSSFVYPNITDPTVNTANNKFNTGQGWSYDAAGNVTTDANGNTFTFDAENKQVEAKNSSSTILGTYYFDGDGKRVKKVVPSGETTIFVYDAGGKSIAEYSTTPSTTPQVQYLTNDNLGTPRINTDRDGNVNSRSDYMPYGEEIVALGGRSSTDKYVGDDVRQGFTGYESDEETGLDYAQARMYAKSLGRFNSADPLLNSGRPWVPESWNRYVYAFNNCLRNTDPTGLYVWDRSMGGDSADGALDRVTRFRRQNFRDGLSAAAKNAEKVKSIFGENSEQYKKAKSAVDSYGKEGDKGVTVAVVRDAAQTSTGTTSGTKGNMTVAFKESFLDQSNGLGVQKAIADPMGSLIAHEGYHVATNAVTSYENEMDAYRVQGYLEQAWNPPTSFIDLRKADYPNTLKNDEQIDLWNRSWAKTDIGANRDKGIGRILEVAYPKLQMTQPNKKK